MNNLSTISLIFFITSGMSFAVAVFILSIGFVCKKSGCKRNKKKLTIVDEVILIHTNEKIDIEL